MFEWIIKPYLQWTFIDNLMCYICLGILMLIIFIIAIVILNIKDKIKDRKDKKK